MALTSDDLKAIRKVIREEDENETSVVNNDLNSVIRSSGIRIMNDVRELKDRVKNVEIELTKNHKEIKKEIKYVVDFLDKQDVGTQKRVLKFEKHLNLPQN